MTSHGIIPTLTAKFADRGDMSPKFDQPDHQRPQGR
jgi:hypothetical protein